jgi:peptidoglycan/LPS O-acetylase OafA/YrhL
MHAYPADIKPLTGLRFVAAFWLLLYFFGERFAQWGVNPLPVIHYGNYGVDLFFILSGFVLAHVYGPQVQTGRFHYGSFLWARIARIYPTHLATLLMMVVLWFGATKMGATLAEGAFEVSQIPAHLLMIHAWGVVGSDGWNFPSWSISAEWFAYLAFPVLFGAVTILLRAGRGVGGPICALVVSVAMFYVLYMASAYRGVELTDLTWGGGALRIIPSFLGGVALWQLGNRMTVNRDTAIAGLIVAAMVIVTASSLEWAGAGIWPALLAIVFFTAETAKQSGAAPQSDGVIASPTWVWLGEISFAIYMIHLPVDIAYFQLVERLQGGPEGVWLLIHFVLVTIVSVVAGAVLHHFWERPARNFLRRYAPTFARPVVVEGKA